MSRFKMSYDLAASDMSLILMSGIGIPSTAKMAAEIAS
jgi:hypothetical protein